MAKLRLRKNMTLADLTSWVGADDTLFAVLREASFAFLAEPLAIAHLYQLYREGNQIDTEILYELPDLEIIDKPTTPLTVQDESGTPTSKLGVINTLFGLCLLDTTATIVAGSRRTEISDQLRTAVWKLLSSSRGLIGSGDYVAIVSRDPDMPLPPVLRETLRAAGTREFPYRLTFTNLLKTIGREMGIASDLTTSPLENALVTFLYEVAKNAHDHARTTSDGLSLSGIRGVIVQKLRGLSLDELRSRPAFPDQLKAYLSRAWSPSSAPGVLIAITVVDTGPGIHRRLESKAGESDWERLGRAFLPGESSKPQGVTGRGQGLHLVLDGFASCEKLRAFLFVRSANLLAYRDFTDQDFSAAHRDKPHALQPWDQEIPGGIGTALTVLWPVVRQPESEHAPSTLSPRRRLL